MMRVIAAVLLVGCTGPIMPGRDCEDSAALKEALAKPATPTPVDATGYYANTISIRESEKDWFEVCTNDAAQARSWSNLSAQGDVLNSRETNQFFEFERAGGNLDRVHKCSFVNRSRYNRMDRSSTVIELGTLGQRPLDGTTVEKAAFYLWAIENGSNAGNKILSSRIISETASEIVVEMEEGKTSTGDWGIPNTMRIRTLTVRTNTSTGVMVQETGPVTREESGSCH